MKAIVNKPLTHMLFNLDIAEGTEIEVEDEVTLGGMVQITGPKEYAEIFISTNDIDRVEER